MSNPNHCATCKHFIDHQDGHCYMFKDAPTCMCLKHTDRAVPSQFGSPELQAMILSSLICKAKP
jgi:hypothetical protein